MNNLVHLHFHTVGGMSSDNFLEVGLLNGGINTYMVWFSIAIFPATGLVSFAFLPAMVKKSACFPLASPTEYAVKLLNIFQCSR